MSEAIAGLELSGNAEIVGRFERQFAACIGRKFAIAVNSGTSALVASLVAAGVRPGTSVLVPDFGMIAAAFAIEAIGATPLPVDVDGEHWNIRAATLEAADVVGCSALVLIENYGALFEVADVCQVARRLSLPVIEDAAEAFSGHHEGIAAGRSGDLACFSFYANKHITTGEGGAIVTDDAELAELAKTYTRMAFGKVEANRYLHSMRAASMRLSGMQAALGIAQLQNLQDIVVERDAIASRYRELLDGLGQFRMQRRHRGRDANWVFPITLADGNRQRRDRLIDLLRENGIETRPFFEPLHRQRALSCFSARDDDFPNSSRLADTGLYLPLWVGLRRATIDRICSELVNCYKRA